MIKPSHCLLLALSLIVTACGNTESNTTTANQQAGNETSAESVNSDAPSPAVDVLETEPPESVPPAEPTDDSDRLVDDDELPPPVDSAPVVDNVALPPSVETDLPVGDAAVSPPVDADLPVGDAVSSPPVDADLPVGDAVSSPTVESDNGPVTKSTFELSLNQARAALEEGNNEGTAVIIEASPDANVSIELAIAPENPVDAEGIEISLSQQSLDSQNRSATATFTMPVGIQPRLEQQRTFIIRASSGAETITQSITLDITPVSAPDVYLLIGQSNMVGSSEDGATLLTSGGAGEQESRIRQLNVTGNDNRLFTSLSDYSRVDRIAGAPRYIQAQDPLHEPLREGENAKEGTRVGLGISFARAALNNTSQEIYLVPSAWGSSGFCDALDGQLAWNAQASDNTALGGTGLLERALARLNLTLQDTGGVFRGILWHQGEADSERLACANSYAQNLALMVERIRAEASVDARGSSARGPQAPIPFIVGTMSRGQDSRGDYSILSETKETVDSVHRQVSDLIAHADWVNNDDLVPSAYPCGADFCVHFGSLALREMGQRYYQALERVQDRQ